MRVLHLYRPRLPDTRAQSIQVLRTCHALAVAGHEVTLLANKGRRTHALWEEMGLEPHEMLNLQLAPTRHPGLSGVWFRRAVTKWWAGPPGMVLARDKKRLAQHLRAEGKREHRVILEVHELDSLQDDGHLDPIVFTLERECLEAADALVANCEGTLSAWREHHKVSVPTLVCHNATHVQSSVSNDRPDTVVVLGTMRDNKGTRSILNAVQALHLPFRWVGGTKEERLRWSGEIQLEEPIPHAQIEEALSEAGVLLLPLGDNPFSHRFTSPLKLWDYLATDRPIVAANTQAIRDICRGFSTEIFTYQPDDIESIRQAVLRASRASSRTPIRRTWMTRANEISSLFSAVQ